METRGRPNHAQEGADLRFVLGAATVAIFRSQ
jgi:hypothetical protein